MKYDFYKKCYEKTATFIQSRPLLKKALPLLDKALTVFFFAMYAALVLYALLKKMSAVALMEILFLPLLCLLVVTVLRMTVERPRPYTENGANITPIIQKKNSDNQSFPSRHVASAMVIANVFLPYFSMIAIALYFFALILAFVRFAAGLHYISDLAVGGGIGFILGLLVFVI